MDVDNTLFDWVLYYTHAFEALIKEVSTLTKIPEDILFKESSTVFTAQDSIEYPFLIQSLPSVAKLFRGDVTGIIDNAVNPGRIAFLAAAEPFLKPYADVEATLDAIKASHPNVKIAALTDAPRYVAMWKMNKLGILRFFDAVYGLPDPVLPKDEVTGEPIVDGEIRQKHFSPTNFHFAGRIRVMSNAFEKPSKEGFQLILRDHGIMRPQDYQEVLWVGDNVQKDIQLGKSMDIPTAWASYGAKVSPELLKRLARFSPPHNIRKNANLRQGEAPWQPDFILENFAELLRNC